MIETHIIKPSATIILGQKSPDISQWTWEFWEWSIGIDIETGTFNGHRGGRKFEFLRKSIEIDDGQITVEEIDRNSVV
jgi:hypothetical protein